ncbi:hypothetical protein BC628DRAFT_63268 [Trametes gibbosa]|nr:hypothetical protein BC628DRAFT_63268 [Trametes gibbosa]
MPSARCSLEPLSLRGQVSNSKSPYRKPCPEISKHNMAHMMPFRLSSTHMAKVRSPSSRPAYLIGDWVSLPRSPFAPLRPRSAHLSPARPRPPVQSMLTTVFRATHNPHSGLCVAPDQRWVLLNFRYSGCAGPEVAMLVATNGLVDTLRDEQPRSKGEEGQ